MELQIPRPLKVEHEELHADMQWEERRSVQGALERSLTGQRRPNMPADQAPTLLLVEDDPGHARLIERNLRRAQLPYSIVVLRDGQAALDYVFPAQEERSARPLPPCLVLLDLNLPGCSGMEVLARLKRNACTKHIPVIMLTTTDEPHEIEQCYALGCNAYLTKPVAYDQFVEVLQNLGRLLTEIAVPKGPS